MTEISVLLPPMKPQPRKNRLADETRKNILFISLVFFILLIICSVIYMRQRRTSDAAEEHQREYQRQRTLWRQEGGDMSEKPKKSLRKLEISTEIGTNIEIEVQYYDQ